MTDNSVGNFVIAVYRSRPGKEQALLDLLAEHLPILRSQDLVTERDSLVLRSTDGTLLEIFEWKSREAVEKAHQNEVVKAMWGRFWDVCECHNLASLDQAKELFPHFQLVELGRPGLQGIPQAS